jgi:hypothetical protein
MRYIFSLPVAVLASCAVSGGSSSNREGSEAAAGAAPSPPPAAKASSAAAPREAAAPSSPSPSSPALSQQSPTLRVSSCTPCRFTPKAGLDLEIRFSPGADKSVAKLDVTGAAPTPGGGSTAPQSLPLTDAWSPTNEFLLQALDLDFDGTLDLAFGPILGTPNLALEYWLVEPGHGSLSKLGSFSNLKLNPTAREVETYEKGGHAGLLFESKVYRWESGQLALVRSVEQTEVPGQKYYLKTTRSFEAGRTVKESKERVKAP